MMSDQFTVGSRLSGMTITFTPLISLSVPLLNSGACRAEAVGAVVGYSLGNEITRACMGLVAGVTGALLTSSAALFAAAVPAAASRLGVTRSVVAFSGVMYFAAI